KIERFRQFVTDLFSLNIEQDDEYVILTSEDNSINCHEFSIVFSEFCSAKIEKEGSSDNQLIISSRINRYDGDYCVYLSLDRFLTEAIGNKKVPNKYVILKEKISSIDDTGEVVKKISVYLKWVDVLRGISNHAIDKKYIIYIPDESGGKEIIIESSDRLDFISDLIYKVDSDNAAGDFLNILNTKDLQSDERLYLMRASICNFLEERNDSSIKSIIEMGDKVHKRYKALLDLYTKKFSVNKILSEIDQKQLEYTAKINDFISSSQSKAFAIPSALIAVGGLAKSSGLLDSILIYIGLCLVYVVTYISNDALRESYNSMVDELDGLKQKYIELKDGEEVKSAVDDMLRKVKFKIAGAQKRIIKINFMSAVMVIVGGMYLVLKLFHS
ncbi:hypothetical protein PN925_001338, partial [Morganella morganii]|nr:hypothetical protein [Morganella morganii]